MTGTRPRIVETRAQFGHWEIDTIMGPTGCNPRALTMVERKTGFLMLGQLKDKSMQETASAMVRAQGVQPVGPMMVGIFQVTELGACFDDPRSRTDHTSTL